MHESHRPRAPSRVGREVQQVPRERKLSCRADGTFGFARLDEAKLDRWLLSSSTTCAKPFEAERFANVWLDERPTRDAAVDASDNPRESQTERSPQVSDAPLLTRSGAGLSSAMLSFEPIPQSQYVCGDACSAVHEE